MTKGWGVWNGLRKDDVIYEQPLTDMYPRQVPAVSGTGTVLQAVLPTLAEKENDAAHSFLEPGNASVYTNLGLY